MFFVKKCGLFLLYFFILVTNVGLWIAIVQLLRSLDEQNSNENNKKIAAAVILGLISLFLMLIIGCFAKKIKLALSIINAASEFTGSTQRIVFV
jgi:hypothetical protein